MNRYGRPVGALSWSLLRVPDDDVLARVDCKQIIQNIRRSLMNKLVVVLERWRTVVDELVELNEEMPVLGDADGFALVVVFGSKEDTDDCVGYVLFAVYGDLVLVRVVVQPLEMSLNLGLYLFLLLLLLLLGLAGLRSDRVEVDEVVSEEGDEFADIDVLDGDTGEDEVVVLLVEGWVVDGGLSKFQSGWSVVPYVFDFRGVAKKFASCSLEASVVPVWK